jgi:alkylation response protein AidB-like acyl-CoA dehydrogenase
MDAHDPSFSRRLAERGWVGMTWPRQYGGGERTELERYVVIEELLAEGAPIAAHWFADRQVGPQLLRIGTESQRQRYLPAMATGTLYVSIGMSEPGAGSDLAAVRTTATRADGGWLLNGTKIWTSHAHLNHVIIALCRSGQSHGDRHRGLSQFIVALDADGIDVVPIESMDGHRHFAEVTFRDAFVGDGDVLGEVDWAWPQVTAELARERSGPERFLSLMPLLQEAVRQMAGAPSSADAEFLGRTVAELVLLRRLSLNVASALERGESPDIQAALVKDVGTHFEQQLIEDVCRLDCNRGDQSSPRGFTELVRMSLLASPGFTLRGGATEVLRSTIGRAVTGSP